MQTSKHILALVVLVAVVSTINAENRKVEVEWNPGCTLPQCTQPKGPFVNLVYVKLTGNTDTVHVFYSTIGSFSVQLVRANNTAKMSIDWEKLLSGNSTAIYHSIQFSESVIDNAGYEIASIYEFNDPNGKADLAQTNQTHVYRTQDLIWDKFNASADGNSGFFKGRLTADANSSFQFAVRYPGKDAQRDTALPHLLLNGESSSIEFIIDHIEPIYNMSKFGLNVIYLTEFEKVTTNSIRTIDDEYTPGTFKLWNAEVADETQTRNYLQWKPIFYYEAPKTLESSTLTKKYELKSKSEASTSALGLAFYESGKLFTSMNVSFGLEGSEKDVYFYKQSNYTSWTFSVGVGKPPVETMSFIVTLVIIVGFGLPAVVILVGLVVMIVKKIRGSRNSDFQPL